VVDLESGVKNLFQKLSSPELQDSELHFEDGSYLLIFEDLRGSMSLTCHNKDIFWVDVMVFKDGRVECQLEVKGSIIFCSFEEVFQMSKEFSPAFFNWMLWNLV
jgi:hypothetical protein